MIDKLVCGAVGSVMADKLSATLTGPSPHNGSLPFAFVLEVFSEAVDDKFVVSIRRDSDLVSRITSPFSFERETALCEATASLLGAEPHSTLAKLTGDLANYGYRFLSLPTGMLWGHTETVTIVADASSELDAALKLESDPEYIYHLLDGGADSMRHHQVRPAVRSGANPGALAGRLQGSSRLHARVRRTLILYLSYGHVCP